MDLDLSAIVTRACLAPSVHNVQPARWALDDGDLVLACDLSVSLAVGDPELRDAGLSCGAAVEATVLALSAMGIGAQVSDLWETADTGTIPGHRLAARLSLSENAQADGLHRQLEPRHTWRGLFETGADLFGWDRKDAILITDRPRREWLSELNDAVSHDIMGGAPFRRELLSWMRLSRRNRRYGFDGLNRDALGFSGVEAMAVPLALGPLWGLLHRFGQTRALTAEGPATLSSPVIACFYRPLSESPVTSGRAYLRMCLEATSLGLAGWPMAALSDHSDSNAEICSRLAIAPDHRLVQVIRFGKPTGVAAPRARRPLQELILS